MKYTILGFLMILLLSCDECIGPFIKYDKLIIQPGYEDGKDAEIWNLPPSSSYAQQGGICDTTNFGDKYYFRAATWSYYGDVATHRGFIEFNIDKLPIDCNIDSAYLFLFSEISTGQTQTGANHCYLNRILETWDEHTIMWYNQPLVAFDSIGYDYIVVPPSIKEDQDYKIDMTSFVKYWYENPGTNHGVRISLVKEIPLARAFFASSEYHIISRRPKLIVYYKYES